LLGLGKLGREVIRQSQSKSIRPKFYWIGDSKCFVSRLDRKPFTVNEMRRFLKIKTEYPNQFAEKSRNELAGVDVFDFNDLPQQADLIQRELISKPRESWVIIDTSTTLRKTGGMLVRSALGCASYCSANKSPWAEYELCSELYADATRKRTLLGLNCVAGVWVDQMEILPILMQKLRHGRIIITKRDNSSLNTFLALVARGISPEDALAELAARGHLEPGAEGLLSEIRDQITKAKIAANICGILRHVKPSNEGSFAPESMRFHDPSEIASWHISGRKTGVYPALVTQIVVDTKAKKISCSVKFTELTRDHPLAKDFDGKNAMTIQGSNDVQFEWSPNLKSRSGRGLFVHSGYGGASKTAAKPLWETKRAVSLISSRPQAQFSPIPVLWGLSGETEAKRLERKLAANLSSLAVPSGRNT